MDNTENASGADSFPTSHSRLQALHFDVISLHGSIEERTELARQINGAADALATAYAELRRSANSLLSVMRLPAEILLIIFTLVSEEDPPAPPLHRRNVGSNGWGSTKNGPYGSLGWVKLLHVCHGWRSLIENTPVMWARHVYRLPAAADAFIERSRHLPLHIDITSSDVSCSLCDCCRRTEPYTLARQTRSLCWRVTHSRDLDALMAFMRQRAMPLLRNADIQYEYAEGSVDYRSLDVIDAPQLRELVLHKLLVPFTAVGLTSFRLENVQVSDDELLHVLQRYPNLEDLILEECFLDAPASSGRPIVELNRLGSMIIREGEQLRFDTLFIVTPSNYITFLQKLRLSRATIYLISLHSEFPEMMVQDLSLLSIISQSIQRHDLIVGMRISDSVVNLFTSVGAIDPVLLPELDRFFIFEGDGRCSYRDYDYSMDTFTQFLAEPESRDQFQALTVLTILCYDVMDIWKDLALALPNLRVFHVAATAPERVLNAVVPSSTGEGVLLPHLRHFGVWGVEGLLIDERTLSALVRSLTDRCEANSGGKLASHCVGQLADRRLKAEYTPRLALYAGHVGWPDDPDDVSTSGLSGVSSVEETDQ
ncbi:hypothetical protein PENSPDRAFT_664535 [Peniophora sp. CONT]|nr:hypothetical protein PENSPDRAFT_664535 [Peniophora sp. CONT]